ncbi:transposase family protein [Virgibacillus pantothenticus]|uniref:transposase family protein n=1 Tax=Virgibacillus pantothenticus TaxID=1473 RepID=UPI001C23635D|nr:transposase family protein [Virgibacillus pantothenticus]MBU8601240.1 transposase family protein [Virgibacillus pantothenticus]MBU8635590.1 transposase family protein [Virgibacillus pantothenticus]MBU8647470.1 transposase family protein [Virgibacillus pantothenticus]MBU8661288.1 transposase family protein [Virgibacillus pantothenticus]MBU8665143.1 transposase family protein [Virgibacillus pantothenticus]
MKQVKDSRHQSNITYSPDVILMMVIIKNASNIETMREMTDEFNLDICIEKSIKNPRHRKGR